jgi:hypothetical protein
MNFDTGDRWSDGAVCTMHGKQLHEHFCLYCCLCFKDLTPEQCHVTPSGEKEDVCNECTEHEEKLVQRRKKA